MARSHHRGLTERIDMQQQLPGANFLKSAFNSLKEFQPQTLVPSIVNRFHKRKGFTSAILTLHTTATPLLLCMGISVLGFKEYFGEGVRCVGKIDETKLPGLSADKFCFQQGTFFTQPAYPGVYSSFEKTKHNYYQWVYFVLLFQVIFFSLASTLWRIKQSQLTSVTQKLKKNYKQEGHEACISAAADCVMLGRKYLGWLRLCHLYCILHLLLEIVAIDFLLSGLFLKLGIVYLNTTSLENQINYWVYPSPLVAGDVHKYAKRYGPLNDVFPAWAICEAETIGASGENQPLTAKCFLPLNNVNAKIFIWMWFWFVFLSVSTVLLFLWQFTLESCSYLRFKKLKRAAPNVPSDLLRRFARQPGYYFVLLGYAQVFGPNDFAQILFEIERKFFVRVKSRIVPIRHTPEQQEGEHLCGVQVVSPSEKSKSSKKSKKPFKSKASFISTEPSAPIPELHGLTDISNKYFAFGKELDFC